MNSIEPDKFLSALHFFEFNTDVQTMRVSSYIKYLKDWLKKNASGWYDVTYNAQVTQYGRNNSRLTVSIGFEKEEDAVLFKITWG